jgi:hypothetical protein
MEPVLSLHFFQRLSSQIFHDLVSPFSAIFTGVSFLSDQPDAAEMLPITMHSCTLLKNKFDLMRMVFGSPGLLSQKQIEEILENLTKDTSVTLELALQDIPRAKEQQILGSCFLWATLLKSPKKNIALRVEKDFSLDKNNYTLTVEGHFRPDLGKVTQKILEDPIAVESENSGDLMARYLRALKDYWSIPITCIEGERPDVLKLCW